MPREIKQPSFPLRVPTSAAATMIEVRATCAEGSSQLGSATSLAHEEDQLQSSKKVDAIRASVASLRTHARVLKGMSEEMTAISAKLQELQDEKSWPCA